MLRNQATALIRHEHLTTTVPRAKELRPFVERLITIAKRGIASGSNGHTLTARRLVMQDLQDRQVVRKLFDTIAPRFAERPGGYTRLLRLGYRKGDSAEIAHVELVGSEFNPRATAEAQARTEGELGNATEWIRRSGGRALYVTADVTEPWQLEDVARRAVQEFGGIDTWVNNAGIGMYGRLVDQPLEEKRKIFDASFWSVV